MRTVPWYQSLCVSRFEFVTEVLTDTSTIRPLRKRMNDTARGILRLPFQRMHMVPQLYRVDHALTIRDG
jgi:hypothetical protein